MNRKKTNSRSLSRSVDGCTASEQWHFGQIIAFLLESAIVRILADSAVEVISSAPNLHRNGRPIRKAVIVIFDAGNPAENCHNVWQCLYGQQPGVEAKFVDIVL